MVTLLDCLVINFILLPSFLLKSFFLTSDKGSIVIPVLVLDLAFTKLSDIIF